MGYVIRRLAAKSRNWKVQYQSRIGGQLRTRDLKETELRSRGLLPSMLPEEVKQILDSLNAREAVERIGAKRARIAERLEERDLKVRAHFPKVELEEFERRELYRLIKPDSVARQKRKIHWDAVSTCISTIDVPVSEWSDERARFYDYFLEKEWSPSYVQKLLPLINKWGSFFSRRRKLFFEPIPYPSGNDLEALAESSYTRRGDGNTSLPLTPGILEKGRAGLEVRHYNWLYLSVWFGLRPLEVDNLKQPQGKRTWQVVTGGKAPVLWVYQTKLHGKGLRESERLKPIPCICPEQRQGLAIIKDGEFKRPLVKTIVKHCGAGINTYGGRKGFTDLWLERGQSLENISIWLGHRSIERTWKSYKDKQAVRWD